MKKKKAVKITFAKDNVKTELKSGKKRVSKNISVKDFMEACSSNLILRTGIMSPGIKYYSKKGNKEVIAIETPLKKLIKILRYVN